MVLYTRIGVLTYAILDASMQAYELLCYHELSIPYPLQSVLRRSHAKQFVWLSSFIERIVISSLTCLVLIDTMHWLPRIAHAMNDVRCGKRIAMSACYDLDPENEPRKRTEPRLLIPPRLTLKTRQDSDNLALVAFCPLPEEPIVNDIAIQRAVALYAEREEVEQVDHEALLIPGRHFRLMELLLRFLNWIDRLCHRRSPAR